MSSEPIKLEPIIKNRLAPILRNEGFSGSGRTFRRIRNGIIHVVNVQGSRYGGQFAINLAIQPLAIPDSLGNTPDPKKIVESECELRRRLSESGADQWWKYNSLPSLEAAMDSATETYIKYGRPLFEKISEIPSPIDNLTAVKFAEGNYSLQGFGSTKVRMALAFARIKEAEGNINEAIAFARYGLENVGNAVSLKNEFQRMAALPNKSMQPTPYRCG